MRLVCGDEAGGNQSEIIAVEHAEMNEGVRRKAGRNNAQNCDVWWQIDRHCRKTATLAAGRVFIAGAPTVRPERLRVQLTC